MGALAPKMLERGYGTLLDRLLNQVSVAGAVAVAVFALGLGGRRHGKGG